MNKKLGITKGYKLHYKRYKFFSQISGRNTSGTRTMKYQLRTDEKTSNELAKMIIHDHNITFFNEDTGDYPLISLWLDFLAIGAVFAPSHEILMDTINKSHGQSGDLDIALESIETNIKQILNIENLKTLLQKTGVRKSKGDEKEKISKVLLKVFLEDTQLTESQIELKKQIFNRLMANTRQLSELQPSIKEFFNLTLPTNQNKSKPSLTILRSMPLSFELPPDQLALRVNNIIHLNSALKSQKSNYKGEPSGKFVLLFENNMILVKPLFIDSENNRLFYMTNAGISYIYTRQNSKFINALSYDIIKQYVGLDANFNAFSWFFNKGFELLFNDTETLIDIIIQDNPIDWENNRIELTERIEKVKERNKELALHRPYFGKGWHDYRSSIGSKLASYTSNLINRIAETFVDLAEIQNSLENISDNIVADNDRILKQYIDESQESLELILPNEDTEDKQIELSVLLELRDNIIAKYKDIYVEFEKYTRGVPESLFPFDNRNQNSYDYHIADVFIKFNKDTNLYYAPFNLFNPSRVKQWPVFYGSNRIKARKAYLNAFKTYTSLLEGVNGIIQKVEFEEEQKNEISFRKLLQSINNIAKKASPPVQNILENQLSEYFSIEVLRGNKYLIIKSPFSTNRLEQARLKKEITDFTSEYYKFLNNLSQSILGTSIKALTLKKEIFIPIDKNFTQEIVDKIEIAKIVLGVYFNNCGNIAYNPSLIDESILQALKIGFNDGDVIKPKQIQIILQAGYMSNIKAQLTYLTLSKIIKRYSIQITNGEQSKLTYIYSGKNSTHHKLKNILPSEYFENFTKNIKNITKKDLENLEYLPHSWGIGILHNGSAIYNTSPEKSILIDKNKQNTSEIMAYESKQDATFLPIISSNVQKQFLDKLFREENDKVFHTMLQGQSLILEQYFHVNWNTENSMPEEIWDKNIFYVAIPFSLEYEKKNEKLDNPKNFMGIDLGEFGLAYSILNQDLQIIKQGFIGANQFKEVSSKFIKLRADVVSMKEKQKKGYFENYSTHIQNLRIDLTTSLKNIITSIALQSDSIIVFEKQVSSFEVGSNRISKLYASIKNGLINPSNDADRSKFKQLWGSDRPIKDQPIAIEIDASKTSQYCTACGRHPINEFENIDLTKYPIKIQKSENKSYIISPNDPSIKLFLYSPKSLGEIITNKIVLGKLFKMYMRKPADKTQNRGSQFEYDCCFSDCQNHTDADIQASINIAIKGIVKNKAKIKSKEDYLLLDRQFVEALKNFTSQQKEEVKVQTEVMRSE